MQVSKTESYTLPLHFTLLQREHLLAWEITTLLSDPWSDRLQTCLRWELTIFFPNRSSFKIAFSERDSSLLHTLRVRVQLLRVDFLQVKVLRASRRSLQVSVRQ